jgi:hypothetical protein
MLFAESSRVCANMESKGMVEGKKLLRAAAGRLSPSNPRSLQDLRLQQGQVAGAYVGVQLVFA